MDELRETTVEGGDDVHSTTLAIGIVGVPTDRGRRHRAVDSLTPRVSASGATM